MENGQKPEMEKKMENQMEKSPQLDKGEKWQKMAF